MAKKIKCPRFGCGSTDVEYLSGNQKTTLNLNPLHPFTLVNTKPKGKQKFRCKKCGRVFEAENIRRQYIKTAPVLAYRDGVYTSPKRFYILAKHIVSSSEQSNKTENLFGCYFYT